MLLSAALVVTACTSDDSSDAPTTTQAGGETTTAPTDGETPETTEGETPETTDGETPETTDGETPETTEPDGEDGVGGSACGTPHGPYEDRTAEGEVRVAWNDPPLSFNNNTFHGNATAIANILYMTQAGFTYYDGDLNLINNDQFGTCTLDSLDPLTITYRINEGVTWSDGVQIDAADMLLTWGSSSGDFSDPLIDFLADGTAIQTDEDGNWLVTTPDGETRAEANEDYDPETGSLLEGFDYVPATGIAFASASEAMEMISPENVTISDDGLALTVTYDSFYVDYPYAAVGPGVPAHVTAMHALDLDDPAAAKQAVIDAFTNNDTELLGPIASFWNTGFDTNKYPSDPSLILSSGPYTVTEYDEVSQLVLEANPNYNWGPKPNIQTIVYRIIGDPSAAVTALANEEIDVFQPQATADLVTELEGYADRGVVASAGVTAVYEHVDFAVTNNGPFDPNSYGGDAEVAKKVRQALMHAIPRQEIIDRLIKPIDPEAQIRNSFTIDPGAPWYEDMVANNGSDVYAETDLDKARALLEEAGVETPINVRVLYAANNPRRASIFELIKASADQVGFNLIDGSSPTWGSQLGDISSYDMNFFGWQSTSTAVGGSNANYITTGGNNFYGYSNPDVDALFEELNGTADQDRQKEIMIEAEQHLWEDAFGITIFQHPGLTGYNANYVEGVDPISLSPTIFWNVWDWTIPS